MVVTLHKAGFLNLGGELVLKSGANEVDQKIVKNWHDNPTVKELVSKGELEYNAEYLTKDSPPVEQHLTDMKLKEAIDLIKQTIDSELLEKWKSVEKRKSIIEVLDKQLKELSEPVVLRSEGELNKSEELTSDESED